MSDKRKGVIFMRLIYIDEIDFMIISELKKNGSDKLSEVAKKVHLNERSVRRRLKRLIEFKVLEPIFLVNASFLGYVLTIDIFLSVDPERLAEVEGILLEMEEVVYIAEGENGRELSIQGRFKDNASLFSFLHKKLPVIDGVLVKGYTFIPNIIKSLHQWAPTKQDLLGGKSFREQRSDPE